jgi:hypothetical protein
MVKPQSQAGKQKELKTKNKKIALLKKKCESRQDTQERGALQGGRGTCYPVELLPGALSYGFMHACMPHACRMHAACVLVHLLLHDLKRDRKFEDLSVHAV